MLAMVVVPLPVLVLVSPLALYQPHPTCTAGLMAVAHILVVTARIVLQDTRLKLPKLTRWRVASGDASDMEGAGKNYRKKIKIG